MKIISFAATQRHGKIIFLAAKKNCEGLKGGFICSLVFSEAREAFIKQFSLLEASTVKLLAHLHGITATLNCSISMREKEGNESRKDDENRGVCQTFTETIFMMSGSQKQLQQATLDLDNMVGHILSSTFCFCPKCCVSLRWKRSPSPEACWYCRQWISCLFYSAIYHSQWTSSV